MGFFVMIFSMLIGMFFIAFGIFRREHKHLRIILIVLGIVFVLIAIYLGLPK
jgi:threonine/homoserine/homoserine lactone efflux protein